MFSLGSVGTVQLGSAARSYPELNVVDVIANNLRGELEPLGSNGYTLVVQHAPVGESAAGAANPIGYLLYSKHSGRR
jgi:hypothetical protein